MQVSAASPAAVNPTFCDKKTFLETIFFVISIVITREYLPLDMQIAHVVGKLLFRSILLRHYVTFEIMRSSS